MEASGHKQLQRPMIDNKDSKIRYRADKLVKIICRMLKVMKTSFTDGLSFEQMKKLLTMKVLFCPVSKTANWTEIPQFNLMFKTFKV